MGMEQGSDIAVTGVIHVRHGTGTMEAKGME